MRHGKGTRVLNRGLIGEEEAVVNHGSEDTSQEWSDPIDAVVGPVAGGKSGSESPRGIDSGAREWPSEQNAYGDRQADRESGHFVERASGINQSGKKDEDEKERHHAFEQHSVQAREVRS